MNHLKTLKTLTHNEGGPLFIEEYELEAFRRNEARALENIALLPELPDTNSAALREYLDATSAVAPDSLAPVIEPLRSWKVGTFSADGPKLLLAALEWLGKRTIPLQEGEVDELNQWLLQRLDYENPIQEQK